MSKYADKSDFADTCEIHGIENMLKSEIFVGQDIVPLRIDSEKDLVPFYPFIVAMSASESGIGTFFLSSESYVDEQEREILGWYQRDAVKYVKKCKRKKVQPKFEDMPSFMKNHNEEQRREVFNRVLDGNMYLDGIHLPMQDYYRQNLYEEMLRVGWEDDKAYRWCFGWDRWLAKKFKN